MSYTTRPILLFLLLAFAYAHTHSSPYHTCIHDQIEHDAQFIEVPHESKVTGRSLQTTYKNIRITFDFSLFSSLFPDLKTYIQNVVLPPVENYFEAALQVDPIVGTLTTTLSNICSGTIIVPTFYNSIGVNADLVIFVTTTTNTVDGYVAFAGSCVQSMTNNRPVFGRIVYNTAKIYSNTNKAQIERDTMVTFHELTHALGFSDWLFPSYIFPENNTVLTGHVFSKSVNGKTTKVLDLPPLTDRIRDHFACPDADGAYLENEGGTGSANTHFERRVFYNEYMTASTLEDFRISQFSLSLLEGTGWYKVDYSMAEPMTWGKNKGCAFLDSPCVNPVTKTGNFKEFCSGLKGIGCSWTGRGGSACGAATLKTIDTLPTVFDYFANKTQLADAFADNCPIYDIYENLDCENELNQGGSTLPNYESYGYGSKCFIGSLYKPGYTLAPNGYCFKYKCDLQTNGSYIVRVQVGNITANCSFAGKLAVTGLGGKLYCPNPDEFCQQMEAEGYCRKGCSGRGKCVNKKCQCIDGWGSHDCSEKTYKDNCAKCVTNSLKTSCFGDTCQCNPANITCMCKLGLTTGTICTTTTTTTTTSTYKFTDGVDGGNRENEDTTTNQPTGSSNTPNVLMIVGISVGGTLLVVFAIIFAYQCRKKFLRARAKKPTLKKGASFANPVLQNQMAHNPTKYENVEDA